jgi:hypothetical protein
MKNLWINVADLQLFDVIVTTGRSKLARLILNATHGRFTHAALAWGQADLMEADALGTTTTKLDVRFIKNINGRQYDLAVLPGHPTEAVVLRHPKFTKHQKSDIFRSVVQSYKRYAGLRYTKLSRLSKLASTDRPIFHKALRYSAALIDIVRPIPKSLQGPFCSEFVAYMFEKRGLELFDKPKLPYMVTPDDLISSRLHVVEGILFDEESVSRLAGGYVPHHTTIPWFLTHSPRRVRRLFALWDFLNRLK